MIRHSLRKIASRTKRVRKRQMEGLLRHLGGPAAKGLRVTLFEEVGRIRSLFFFAIDYLRWYSDQNRILSGLSRALLGLHPQRELQESMPRVLNQAPRYGRYLRATLRVGSEFPTAKPRFCARVESAKYAEGIAGKVWQTQSAYDADDLPDIRGVDLGDPSMKLDGDSETARKVREYMKRSGLHRLDSLRLLNVRALHIYGDLINRSEDNAYVAVLVVDSERGESFLTEETRGWLQTFCAGLGSTYR